MNPSEVVIHFIGIVLFSTQVTSDPGLHAILPAIKHDFNPWAIHNPPNQVVAAPSSTPTHNLNPPAIHHRPTQVAAAAPSNASPSAAPGSFSTHIEQHVALLVFREDIVVNDSQWKAKRIVSTFRNAEELAAYKYVELTGEHVTFVVDSPSNPLAKLPADMPRLPTCGRSTGELTSGFQWPYTQAAAVVDIPEGTLSACHARKVANGRIDTTLRLNTTGTLTIVGAKSGVVKTLVLNTTNNPTIYLANVPPPRGKGLAASHTAARHFLAYYRMIGKDETSSCLGSPAGPAVPDCVPQPVFPIIATPSAVFNGRFARMHHRVRALFLGLSLFPPERPETEVLRIKNAECSNSQWP